MIIGITGGIGSGKSVVSRILTSMGYDVYDTDRNAKVIMDASESIKADLSYNFGETIIVDGNIDRVALAKIVFGEEEKLATLNRIVHSHVIEDILKWEKQLERDIVFVETAILYESGLDKHVDMVWQVDAPVDKRIIRVMKRNGLSKADVEKRIYSQQRTISSHVHPHVYTIINDDSICPLLPQILQHLDKLSNRL